MSLQHTHRHLLKGYSALAIAFLTTRATAQIDYTDIDPDIVLSADGDVFNLDLDDNGTIDFSLRKVLISSYNPTIYTTFGNVYPGIIRQNHLYGTALDNNAILGELSPFSYQYPFALDADVVFCDMETWNRGSNQSLVYSYGYLLDVGSGVTEAVTLLDDGFWFGGKTDKYLGLRLRKGSQNFTGWLRLDVAPDNTSATIKDFAYFKIPGQCIATGQTAVPVGVTETTSIFQITQLPETLQITATGAAHLEGVQWKITDQLGRAISYGSNTSATVLQIDIARLPKGMYYLAMYQEGKPFSHSFVVQ
jgi:hypothetical protein